MKYIVVLLLMISVGFSQAKAAQSENVFSCIQQDTLTVDPNCLSKTIELEQKLDQFTSQVKQFEVKEAFLETGYEMATLAYYPELNLIRVIAERPEAAKQQLQTALVTKSN